jgi:hypothetical protein
MPKGSSLRGQSKKPHGLKHSIGLPAFLIDKPVGLGDVIKRVTSAIGVRPCEACAERAERLNKWVAFQPKRQS